MDGFYKPYSYYEILKLFPRCPQTFKGKELILNISAWNHHRHNHLYLYKWKQNSI